MIENMEMKSKKLDGIIFDVDGTLWDAVPGVWQAWRDEIALQGYDYDISFKAMKALFGEQVDTFGDVLFSDMSVNDRRRLAHICADKQINRMRENKLLYPYPKAKEVLEELSQKYPLFIVTNAKDGYTQLFLEFSQTEAYITDFEHANVPGRSKADNIRVLMERNNLKNVIYVGDTAADQKNSTEAGARFIWASYGFGENVENDLVIKSFDELPEIIARISS